MSRSCPRDWKLFFEGLNEDKDIISKNLKGPSWSKKKIFRVQDKKVKEKKLKISNKQEVNISDAENTAKNSVRAIMLIRAYRIRGHLIADLDPLGLQQKEHPELKPETYGFTKKDYSKKIFLDGVLGLQYASLNEILNILKKTYSSKIGYEFMHMGDPEEKAWIRDRIEGPNKGIEFTENGKRAILNKKIIQAEGFEKYLHVKFVGTKRFGLDGAESLSSSFRANYKKRWKFGCERN